MSAQLADPASVSTDGIGGVDLPSSSVAYVEFEVGEWLFAPAISSESQTIEGFVGYYTGDDVTEASITALWFEQGVDGWEIYSFEDGDPGVAAAHAMLARDDDKLFDEHPWLGALGHHRLAEGSIEFPRPMSVAAPLDSKWQATLQSSVDPKGVLSTMVAVGAEVAPELPEIGSRVWERLGNTLPAPVNSSTATSVTPGGGVIVGGGGSTRPVDPRPITCEVRARANQTVDLAASAAGLDALLDELSFAASAQLFNAGVPATAPLGNFCLWGCTITRDPCSGTGAWTLKSNVPDNDGFRCNYSRSGTRNWTKSGLTFWCCNTCTGSGTENCTEIDACILVGQIGCPPGGCP
ncbi:MAG: hypothetical protein CMJ31_12030 [Phycisphaerae bacterium]|nr:hypothetical protein [Phycisphaerae bacterium]